MNEQLLSHLRNGETYRSLLLELRVEQMLASHGWRTRHSAHYDAQKSSGEIVAREIDVDARGVWEQEEPMRSIQLHVMVECKSTKKSILAARQRQRDEVEDDVLQYRWAGEDDDVLRARIVETLASTGVAKDEILLVVEELSRNEGELAILDLLPRAPVPPLRVSSAVDVADQQDRSRSLIWGADQQLISAIEGTAEETLRHGLDDLVVELTMPELGGTPAVEDVSAALTGMFEIVEIFHPVIVIDPESFASVDASGAIEPIRWCRLDQTRVAASTQRWVDIVAFEALEEYVALITKTYREHFASLGLTLIEGPGAATKSSEPPRPRE